MIGSVTKNGRTREMQTYDRICDQKRREKRNVQRPSKNLKLKEES